MTKGTHQFKLVAVTELYKKVQDLFAPTQGAFSLVVRTLGTICGLPAGYLQARTARTLLCRIRHWNAQSWAPYVQDNWRVNQPVDGESRLAVGWSSAHR